MQRKSRVGALFAAASLLAGGAIMATAPAANASGFTFEYFSNPDPAFKNYKIEAYYDGHYAGRAEWNGTPWDWYPGDALRAEDKYADGWGAEATLSTGRVASTLGHDSPYLTKWVTGDLPENHEYTMVLTMWKGGSFYRSDYLSVRS